MDAQGNQHIRSPPSLNGLGYEAKRFTTADPELAMYIIKQPQNVGYLAILGICTDEEYGSSTLFVNFVDMRIDSRSEYGRPRLRQMLAAFWTDTVGRDLEQLRRILFQNVNEEFTRAIVRDRVAALTNVGYSHLLERPHDDIVLNTPVDSSISQAAEAWRLMCAHSKLVRSAIGLLREFPMAGPDEQLAAVQIVINPAFDQAGNAHNFDLEVNFGQLDKEKRASTVR